MPRRTQAQIIFDEAQNFLNPLGGGGPIRTDRSAAANHVQPLPPEIWERIYEFSAVMSPLYRCAPCVNSCTAEILRRRGHFIWETYRDERHWFKECFTPYIRSIGLDVTTCCGTVYSSWPASGCDCCEDPDRTDDLICTDDDEHDDPICRYWLSKGSAPLGTLPITPVQRQRQP